MGPIITLDKSSIQCLSAQEIEFLYRYYTINIAPVLVIEILGDLMKPDKQGALTGKDVTQLSNKLLQVDSAVNAHYRMLIAGSLLGVDVTMDGRPVIPGGRCVQDTDGKRGVVFEESIEEQAVQRWRSGEFSQAEAMLSNRWRESTRQIDLNQLKDAFKPIAALLPESKTFSELLLEIDRLMVIPKLQTKLLISLLSEFAFHPEIASRVFHRWEQGQVSLVKDFSPYAFFCFRVTLAFYLGLARGFVGTRATNRVDLEYAYYAPFTMAFSSRDKFHVSMIPHFLRGDQTFVHGDELKEDLAAIVKIWNSLAPESRPGWLNLNGRRPPTNDNSITSRLWQKYMRPRGSRLTGSFESPYPKHSAEDVLNRMRKIAGDGSPLDDGAHVEFNESEMDFLIRERTISIDDPCPCGSGKKFRVCHLDQVKKSESDPSTAKDR